MIKEVRYFFIERYFDHFRSLRLYQYSIKYEYFPVYIGSSLLDFFLVTHREPRDGRSQIMVQLGGVFRKTDRALFYYLTKQVK